MLRQRSTVAALLGLALAAAGCSDSSQPTVPSDQPEDPSLSVTQAEPDDPNELARGVPGFGGFFLDAQGNPTIYLKNGRERPNAERALDRFLRKQGIDPSRMQVRKGDYDWSELAGWHRKASEEALAVPGAVFADADEAANRVRIGVERGKGANVRSVIARLGIPEAAVIVEETEPVTYANLQGSFASKIGGIQINFPGFLCTLGFNARDGSQASFITNSHCTNTQGGVESTPYWQPLQSANPTQIATEVEDPTYQRNIPGCPKGRKCRFSDASRAAYAASASFTLGAIAKPTAIGSLTYSGTNFSITAEGTPISGQPVNKVGRTTGWTRGNVTGTCVTTNVSGSNIAQICQTFVAAGVGSGDSGSPVFTITSGNNVRLNGILWGGSGSTSFVFSPISNIEQELGALTTS
jgi:hypothetical protein